MVKQSGFTLIEILIVIAVIGTMATVALIIINPAERQAQARDTGRIASVVQLGRAIQGYYTARGDYPLEDTWAQDLLDSADIGTFPAGIAYRTGGGCTTFVQPAVNPTYCYDEEVASGNGFLVYSQAESDKYNDKCPGEAGYFVFSSADTRGGTICSATDPVPWPAGTKVYAQ